MTTSPTLDLDRVRRTAYVHGRALAETASAEYQAHQRAGTFTRHYRPEDTGLEFSYEELGHAPGTWGIYATPVPFLEDRTAKAKYASAETWDTENVAKMAERLKTWRSPLLVRLFQRSGSARTAVHLDNTRTRREFRGLAGVRFKSQTIGLGSDKVYGQFAYLEADHDG